MSRRVACFVLIWSAALTACGGGGGGGDGGGGPAPPIGDSVTVAGRITYERVPTVGGLDYAATVAKPARGVTVEIVDAAGSAVLGSTTTDAQGQYSVTAPANRNVFVRDRAQMRRATPGWDIEVLDNANQNALYVLDSTAFRTDAATITRNLLADSGWSESGGTGYVRARAAAPFAILDSLHSAVQFLHANGGADLHLPPLRVYWSGNNRSGDWRPDLGQIDSGTHYREFAFDGFPPGIYVLGQADVDTDEYDEHVIVHEFHHFLEHAIGRTESPGGPHSIDERLDMRVAFSEGLGNAFSGMVLGDPAYRDTWGTRQREVFTFNLDVNAASPAGFFNEGTVQSLVWDLFDDTPDAADGVALGFAPILEALTGTVRESPALVSLYPFVEALKAQSGAPVAAIDTLVRSQQVFGNGPWGTGETNFAGVGEADPVYHELVVGGGTRRVCGTTEAGIYNKLGNSLFLKFALDAPATVTIRAEYSAAGSMFGGPVPDPDIVLFRRGFLAASESATPEVEVLTRSLTAGEYVIEVYEYSHVDFSEPTPRGVTCMDVGVS